MRALIVDDEPIARKVLREELELLSVEIVAEAANGEEALLQIASTKPDVVFLDIQMPVMGGFELLSNLGGERCPAVIMVTAFDQHAIQAFEAGAVDYLLKPVSQHRLSVAIERTQRILQKPEGGAESLARVQKVATAFQPDLPSSAKRIVGKLGQEYFLLHMREVLAIQADGDLTWILTSKQKYLATQNLRAIESRLTGTSFRRIHRNALVNIEQIRKMSTITSQRWLLTLNNGQEFVVSKRQAKYVRDVLHW